MKWLTADDARDVIAGGGAVGFVRPSDDDKAIRQMVEGGVMLFVDVDRLGWLAASEGVRRTPTVVYYRGGRSVGRVEGAARAVHYRNGLGEL